jgi:hypothetical protein
MNGEMDRSFRHLIEKRIHDHGRAQHVSELENRPTASLYPRET